MFQETRRKRRNTSHVEPRHPTRKLTSVVAGGTNGDTTKDLVLVAAISGHKPIISLRKISFCVMPIESKKSGQVLRMAGVLLQVIGVAFLIVGLVSFSLFAPPCAIDACPSIFSGYYAVYWSEIFAGLVMIALGIGQVLHGRRIQGS